MKHKKTFNFSKNLSTQTVIILLSTANSNALELNQSPPGTVQPYVAPNVILTLDDSTSMNNNMNNAAGKSSTRAAILKEAIIEVFNDTTLLPDKKIRFAWQSMGNCTTVNRNEKWSPSLEASKLNKNSMQLLTGSHRSNFKTYMQNYSACLGSTPTHAMVKSADGYMRGTLHKNGPWAAIPGETAQPYLGCRRNYHILLTDGAWNGTVQNLTQKNYDGTSRTLPDGTTYSLDSDQTVLYRDRETNSSIADWAMYSWASPLQSSTNLIGMVSPSTEYDAAPAEESFENRITKAKKTLERYWNPRYNPATWAHMSTFTIGFSSDALPKKNYTINANNNASDKGGITAPTSTIPYGYDGSFVEYANGTYDWRAAGNDKGHDMWHAALNGRGQFYAVEKGEELKKAFEKIIGSINIQTDPEMTSTATSGSNNTRYDVGKFTGNYEPKNSWKGFITAETAQIDGKIIPNPGWDGKNTSQKIDALDVDSRLIFSWSDKWEITNKYKGGILFKWASDEKNLSATQKIWLQKRPDGSGTDEGAIKGQQRLNYIRGDRSLEGSDSSGYTTAKPYRERQSAQGDIINSIIWYTGVPSSNYALPGYRDFTRTKSTRTPMIYAGGNDGMLHGFSATDGTEKIAYIPQGIIPSLSRLTDPTYNKKHRSFVDGSPMTGDIYTGSDISTDSTPETKWATYLVGALGAGGKGYYVLDVTDPSKFTAANASNLVKIDRTRSTDSALGVTTPNCALSTMSTFEKAACIQLTNEDRDIGNITATPVLDENNAMRTTQITRMNNNRWAVIFGNGYNSANQRPVLLVQYLDGDLELKLIPATTDAPGTGKANDNGLQAPRLVDLNGDTLPDIAYAGDNLGNMWKFDLTSENPENWGVAFAGAPLFSATGPASLNSARTLPQPITAPPTVRANDRKMDVGTGSSVKTIAVGGMTVAFGTGRNATKADESDRNVQTIYSILDNTRYTRVKTNLGSRLQVNPGNSSCTVPNSVCIPTPKALGTGVTIAKLAEQKITELTGTSNGTLASKDADNELNTATWSNYNGWYLDLPAVGERQLKPMEFFDGSNLLVVYSQVPAKGSDVDPNIESCESSNVDEERQYRTFINIMDGKAPSVQIVDINGDGLYNSLDLNVSRSQVSKGSHTLITRKNQVADIDTKNNTDLLARMPEQSLRPNWRQLR